MENKDIKVFDGKSLSDLLKDIYDNSIHKKKQINKLTEELSNFVKRVSDVAVISPIIKEYLDVGVKNDDNLLKLATVIQRIMNKQLDLTEDTSLLSDEEKQELMDSLEEAAASLQDKSDEMQVDKIRKRIES